MVLPQAREAGRRVFQSTIDRVSVFKNMMVYRIGSEWSATVEKIEEGLDKERFVECGASQERSVGWVEPRGEAHGPLVEAVGGQFILKLRAARLDAQRDESSALVGAVGSAR